jgi:hypothetical protein
MIREILLLHHTHTDIGYAHDQPIVWELNRQFIDEELDEIDRFKRAFLVDALCDATVRLTRSGMLSASRCDTLGQEGASFVIASGAVTINVPARGVIGLHLR